MNAHVNIMQIFHISSVEFFQGCKSITSHWTAKITKKENKLHCRHLLLRKSSLSVRFCGHRLILYVSCIIITPQIYERGAKVLRMICGCARFLKKIHFKTKELHFSIFFLFHLYRDSSPEYRWKKKRELEKILFEKNK